MFSGRVLCYCFYSRGKQVSSLISMQPVQTLGFRESKLFRTITPTSYHKVGTGLHSSLSNNYL